MGVIVTMDGAVAELRLDWPETRNAFGPEQGRELRQALEKAGAPAAPAKVVVITAEGPAFSAGGNLPVIMEMARADPEALRTMIYAEFHGVMRAIAESAAVVIAAVDGAAIGFGCDLALAADVTYVGQAGWLAQGWIGAGLIPATGGALYVKRRAGSQAVWRFLAADKLGGPEAEALGLALAAENARDAAITLARKLASFSRPALSAMRRLIRFQGLEDYLPAALEEQLILFADPDFSERAAGLLRRDHQL